TAIGELMVAAARPFTPGEAMTLLLRPEAARLLVDGDTAENSFTTTLQEVSFRGRYQIITVAVADVVLKFELDTAVSLPPPGTAVQLALTADSIARLQDSSTEDLR
ncbi:MAG TPA: TOBE domain-containing protein, partial [Chloroflexota bacterium]|nr:TOBE domain-containing protein [Chloroflexota bacterium]